MDEEVKKIVDEAYRRTLQLMEDKKDQVWLSVNHAHAFTLTASMWTW